MVGSGPLVAAVAVVAVVVIVPPIVVSRFKARVLGPLTRNLAFDRRGFDLEPVDERSANALHYS